MVFHSGQTIQWLRDQLGVLRRRRRHEALAASVPDNGGVYMVPAFAGTVRPALGSRRAGQRSSGSRSRADAAHVVRAAIEAMAYQTRDNVDALVARRLRYPELRVDGGAAVNDLLCQFQADILGIPVESPARARADGARRRAPRGCRRRAVEQSRTSPTAGRLDRVFEPTMSADEREWLYEGWLDAV